MDKSKPNLRLVVDDSSRPADGENSSKEKPAHPGLEVATWCFWVPIRAEGGFQWYTEAKTKAEALENFEKLDIWEWAINYPLHRVLDYNEEEEAYSREVALRHEPVFVDYGTGPEVDP